MLEGIGHRNAEVLHMKEWVIIIFNVGALIHEILLRNSSLGMLDFVSAGHRNE